VIQLVKTKQKELVAKEKANALKENQNAAKVNQEALTSIKAIDTEVKNLLVVKDPRKGVVKRTLKNVVRIAQNHVVHHQQLKKLLQKTNNNS